MWDERKVCGKLILKKLILVVCAIMKWDEMILMMMVAWMEVFEGLRVDLQKSKIVRWMSTCKNKLPHKFIDFCNFPLKIFLNPLLNISPINFQLFLIFSLLIFVLIYPQTYFYLSTAP